jgi:hypothetical protein
MRAAAIVLAALGLFVIGMAYEHLTDVSRPTSGGRIIQGTFKVDMSSCKSFTMSETPVVGLDKDWWIVLQPGDTLHCQTEKEVKGVN